MNWFKRLFKRSLPLNDAQAWRDAGLIPESTSGVTVTAYKALGSSAVWRGVNVLCNAPFKLPLNVYTRDANDSRIKAKAHPTYPLLRKKPNRFMTAANFKRTLSFHAVFLGNGYAAITRNGRDEPARLSILDPYSTFAFFAEGELWYRTISNGQERKLHADDVLHIRGLSNDGIVGLSVIELLGNAIGGTLAADEFAARFFKAGAQASGVLLIPGHLQKEAQLQTVADFKTIVHGLQNAHGTGVLQENVKWVPISINPEQAQMLQTREFQDTKVIANVLGLPPHILGSSDRTSYNSLEMESQSLLDHSFDPLLVQWETECDDKLLTEEEQETHYCEFNRKAMLRVDTATRLQGYKVERELGMASANDLLKRENQPTIGPQGDVRLVPANMVPLSRLLEPIADEQ